jgi:hypothetical protein
MRILRRVPQREVLRARVIFRERGARFHRVRHQAVVDELELGDVLGALERGCGRVVIAEMPVVDRVVGGGVVDQRRAFGRRLGRVDHGRQHLVVDSDLLGRVLGLRQRVGDDHSNRITNMTRLADGERRMRRHLHGRAVLGQDHPAADQVAKLALGELRTGHDSDDAGHAGGRLGIDALDLGVGVRRADKVNVRLPRPADVVGVLALAGYETEIFLAAHGGADPGCTHGASSRSCGNLPAAALFGGLL